MRHGLEDGFQPLTTILGDHDYAVKSTAFKVRQIVVPVWRSFSQTNINPVSKSLKKAAFPSVIWKKEHILFTPGLFRLGSTRNED